MASIFFPGQRLKAHWLTLSFEPELERVFREEQFEKSLTHVRLSILLGIIFYSAFGVLDAWIMPEVQKTFWFIRYGLFLPYSVAVYFFTYTRHFQKLIQPAIASIILLGGLGIVTMISMAPDPKGNLYYGGLMLVFLYGYSFFKLRFVWASAAGLMVILGYEVAATVVYHVPVPILVNNNFFFLTGNLIGMFACYAIEFYTRRDFYQAQLLAKEREKVDSANLELERRVEDRTARLVTANEELIEEIEERIKVEGALRESEERFRSLSENAPDIIYTLDSTGAIGYVNPAWERLLGHRPRDIVGRKLVEFLSPKAAAEFERLFRQVVEVRQTFSDVESDLITLEGSIRHFSLSGSPNYNSSGLASGMVGLLKDVTERRMSEEKVRYIAYHDQLTGLMNRKSFYERLEDAIARSARTGHQRWALLFLDLDRFKDINDSLGHDVGDKLLKDAAARLEACVRQDDLVFRLGGDEFTIIATGLVDDVVASVVAQRILDAVARPYIVQDNEIFVSGSIGISVYPDDGDSVEVLVKNADMAMYAAKDDGNSYRFYTAEMNERAMERMKLDHHLRRALERNELLVYYQPMVDQNGLIVGLEALTRWQHPQQGMIMPGRFIPLAEETGAIVPIGEWVMRTACRQAKAWRDDYGVDFHLAVNLSARQFKQPNLVDLIGRIIDRTGLAADCLQLEITETCIMDDPEDAVDKMEQLSRLGIRFAIDDFGTGYSSLSYLKRFPVGTLKIDRSFVKDSVTNQEDQEIIRTIIAMAHNLNMEPLAEGVETAGQLSFLTEQGCRLMQGFLFSRPIPGSELAKLLRRQAEQGTGLLPPMDEPDRAAVGQVGKVLTLPTGKKSD